MNIGNLQNMHVTKLEYKNVPSAGKQVYAEFSDGQSRPVMNLVAYEPWRQFPPKGLDDLLDDLFTEMIEAWNEKHAGNS